ncbi:MAG: AAA family ATPase [Synergistaceae bacterium]|jgi:predicted kinase|nr:AAA family ATPase [Synergistaceae bacterium]
MRKFSPILYIFSGLPGTGKSTLAKNISKLLDAVYIRIDTIEQGIRDLCNFNVQGEGYRLAYRIAEDNLKIGNNVISDQCNPIKLTREEWNNVALKNNCKYINIEIICSDKIEHIKRIEKRRNEIANLKLPTWEEIIKREYDLWEEEHIIIDTPNKTVEECTKELMEKINGQSK